MYVQVNVEECGTRPRQIDEWQLVWLDDVEFSVMHRPYMKGKGGL